MFVDIAIIVILAIAVFFTVRFIVKKKKQGGCVGCDNCNCDCEKNK